MLGEFDDLAFGDAADLIQVQAALALDVFGSSVRAKKCVGDHGDRGDRGAAPWPAITFPIGEQRSSTSNSIA